MKKLLFTAIMALLCLSSAQAQDRSAYSFKVTPHINQEDELIDSITVDVLVDGVKTYLDFSTTLFTPQSPDIDHQWIVERDINFDGIPDLMIFFGYIGYGGQGGDIYHGYVWDVKTRKFRLEENFSEIPDRRTSLKSLIHSLMKQRKPSVPTIATTTVLLYTWFISG